MSHNDTISDDRYRGQGRPAPNNRQGILSRVESHLKALHNSKKDEWSEEAIGALRSDIEEFDRFREHYEKMRNSRYQDTDD